MPVCFEARALRHSHLSWLVKHFWRSIIIYPGCRISKLKGYRRGRIGKWHLGDAAPFHPKARGFDEFFGFLGGGHQYDPSITDKVEPKINDYQYFLHRNGKDTLSPEAAYLIDMFSKAAVNFITQDAAKDEPFFLYLAYIQYGIEAQAV